MLATAWRASFSTKSDFARNYANEVAIAALYKYITTVDLDGEFCRRWFVTPAGLSRLWRTRKGK